MSGPVSPRLVMDENVQLYNDLLQLVARAEARVERMHREISGIEEQASGGIRRLDAWAAEDGRRAYAIRCGDTAHGSHRYEVYLWLDREAYGTGRSGGGRTLAEAAAAGFAALASLPA